MPNDEKEKVERKKISKKQKITVMLDVGCWMCVSAVSQQQTV